MNGQQQITAAAGVGLIAANYWLGPARPAVAAGAFNSKATPQQTTDAHKHLKIVAAELLFVGIATLIAGASSTAGTAMAAVMAALFVLWAINRYNPTTSKG